MKLPTSASIRTWVLFCVGTGLIVWNGVWGDHNVPTFVVGLMFCGFPFVINLDQLLKGATVASPPDVLVPAPPAPTKEAAP